MRLQEAKSRITIPTLWRRFGFEGEPRRSCRCPFHDVKTPSFSINSDGTHWKCHAHCGSGDQVDFYAKAVGLTGREACIRFLQEFGGPAWQTHSAPRPLPRLESQSDLEVRNREQRRGTWPMFESPVTGEDDTAHRAMSALAKLRHLSL